MDMNNHNVIPLYDQIHWDQPHRDQMLVGDEYVTMSQKVFDQLREYSATMPSGHSAGKMWKCKYVNRMTAEITWYLRWYIEHPENKHQFLIYARKVIIGDWRALAGIK
ncbi:hypothetical protein [Xanthomonas virus PB119]|nr:hypothetical protein [Xanthomonas virus PB119]